MIDNAERPMFATTAETEAMAVRLARIADESAPSVEETLHTHGNFMTVESIRRSLGDKENEKQMTAILTCVEQLQQRVKTLEDMHRSEGQRELSHHNIWVAMRAIAKAVRNRSSVIEIAGLAS